MPSLKTNSSNMYVDQPVPSGPSGCSTRCLREARESSVRAWRDLNNLHQGFASHQDPDPNFARAAEHPSGVSGEGVSSGDPETASIEGPHGYFASAAKHPSGMSGRAVGRSRIISFDLARGFTVLMMPMIHVCMLYSTIPVQQSLLGDILGFIAEGPGAQLFMFLMGVSFTLSARISKRNVFQRSLYLMMAAYVLNFLKFIIPLGLGFMPENLLAELNLERDLHAVLFFLFIGDILQFAAIAYILLYMVSKLRHSPYWALLIAMVVIFASPLLWDWQTGVNPLDHVIGLFNGHPPSIFFPVLPWIVYPLLGLVFGHLLKQNNIHYLLKKTGVAGLGLMIASLCFPPTTEMDPWLPFYRTRPADTLFHISFVLVWLSAFHWISRKIKPNPFFTLLTFCSRNITAIYLVQWILICWCLAFTGYLQLGLVQTLGWMVAVTLITLLLTWKLQNRLGHASRKSI